MPEQQDKDQIQKIPPASGSKRKRNIRVFISSTFQDMQEERDVLVKMIFPQLRKMCMERGVGFTEVDLRWGVTQEQTERGEVLPICLAEIENCRPYFIGLLGERYGWVPDFIPDELIDDQPWLAEHRQRSVTELEIVHGVLHNPDMADHAFFYFRDPSASPTHSENQAEQDKQTTLKNQIRQSGFPVRENYPNAEAVGQLILKDLEEAIDNEFPEQQLTPLESDRLYHEAFAESRAKVYIGRQGYFDRLDNHVRRTGDPLVVLGESGSGKSALLANWGFSFREKHPDTFLLLHFIGSSTDSTDYAAMLRRIMMEIKERYDLPNDIPDKPDDLRSQFPNWLSMAAAQGRFVLVLDALNQLEDKDNAPDLVWLPEFIPPEVRLIVSTLRGRSFDELEKRGWPTMEVQLLEQEERQQLIKEYLLKLYSKRLPQDLVERIASQQQCANPLYLHALLEELRIFGKHEEITSRIDHYLWANDPEKLYELVLTRLEEDYEKDRPGLVGEAMTLLWAAHRGLSETELLEIMDLPRLIWSPLSLALQDSLITRSGLLTFFHDFLRQAVLAKYIKIPEIQKASHLRLANYFEHRDIDQRKIDELPWQFTEAQEWHRLRDCLIDLPFFKAAYAHNEFEVLAFWQKTEDNSDLTCPAAYENVLAAPDEFTDILFPLSALFYARGNLNEALQLWKAQEKHYRATGDLGRFHASFGNQAVILQARGDLDEAIRLHKENERICRKLNQKEGLSASLGNQAVILKSCGDLDGAMALHKEEERICRELGDKEGLSISLGNQGVILWNQGDQYDAMALHKEQERICREIGNKEGLQRSLGNQALILKDRGDLDGAMVLHKEQERICRELGNKNGQSISLGNQGLILKAHGELDEAMRLYKEQEGICRELDNKEGLSLSLGHQALIHYACGDLDDAMVLHKEQERICRELGYKEGLSASLGNQALILESRGDLDGAMALHKEEERICRELGDKEGLQRSLGNQGVILWNQGDQYDAMSLHKEQERICREIGNMMGLSRSLGCQALILDAHGDLDGAMALHKEEERICRELSYKEGLQRSLCRQALILSINGELEGAMALHKEEERICRELGHKEDLQVSLGNQALIHKKHGALDKAMKLHKEQERICRELDNKEGLSRSLGNQASIFQDLGELDEAMRLLKEMERICRDLGDKEVLPAPLAQQALLLALHLNQPGEALPLAEEAYKLASTHGLDALAGQIKPLLDKVRAMLL